MKSKDVKNWRYELSYSEMVELDDFQELLTNAIKDDGCLICGGLRVMNEGLCLECSGQASKKDKEAIEKVGKDYEVLITVRKRNSDHPGEPGKR